MLHVNFVKRKGKKRGGDLELLNLQISVAKKQCHKVLRNKYVACHLCMSPVLLIRILVRCRFSKRPSHHVDFQLIG